MVLMTMQIWITWWFFAVAMMDDFLLTTYGSWVAVLGFGRGWLSMGMFSFSAVIKCLCTCFCVETYRSSICSGSN